MSCENLFAIVNVVLTQKLPFQNGTLQRVLCAGGGVQATGCWGLSLQPQSEGGSQGSIHADYFKPQASLHGSLASTGVHMGCSTGHAGSHFLCVDTELPGHRTYRGPGE